MSNLSFDYLPVCARPGWNPDRLDTSRRILKTGPVQAPGPWRLNTSREDFRYSLGLLKKLFHITVAANSTATNNLGPWWAALDLNQETLRCRILSPYYNSLFVALPRHNYTNRSGAFTNFANGSYLELWKVLLTFVIQSPITFTHIRSVGRHGLSYG